MKMLMKFQYNQGDILMEYWKNLDLKNVENVVQKSYGNLKEYL